MLWILQRKFSLWSVFLFLILGTFLGTSQLQASTIPLVYGDIISLQSGLGNWLSTKTAGLSSSMTTVSAGTTTSPIAPTITEQFQILSKAGISLGTTVSNGDSIYLQSLTFPSSGIYSTSANPWFVAEFSGTYYTNTYNNSEQSFSGAPSFGCQLALNGPWSSRCWFKCYWLELCTNIKHHFFYFCRWASPEWPLYHL